MTTPTGRPDAYGPLQSEAEWQEQGWSDTSVPLTVAPRLGATISLRLEPDDARLVRRAARMTGKTLSDFVRGAALRAAATAVAQAEVPIVVRSVRVAGIRGAASTGANVALHDESLRSTSTSVGAGRPDAPARTTA
jgi:hypothetical protein